MPEPIALPPGVISERAWLPSNQAARYELLIDVGSHRLRLTIHRDSYDFQAFGRVEAWLADAGWQEVVRWPIHTLQAANLSSYTPDKPTATSFRPDVAMMLAEALAVLGVRETPPLSGTVPGWPPPAERMPLAVVAPHRAPCVWQQPEFPGTGYFAADRAGRISFGWTGRSGAERWAEDGGPVPAAVTLLSVVG